MNWWASDMARKTKPVFNAEQLLDEFKVYDQAVDVVSSYHWLFTEVEGLAETVTHFERYPRVPVDGKTVTPDFTVLFNDSTGMVGEVARISLRDESVNSLCSQLHGYSELDRLPGPPTRKGPQPYAPVALVDVLFLTQQLTVKDAVRRILDERFDDPNHPYKPGRLPVVVSFAQNGDQYVFMLWPARNGTINKGNRAVAYGDIDPFSCRPDQFDRNKVQYGFMADPVPALYMATRLWTRVLPSAFWGSEVTVPLDKLVTAVRNQHEGHGTTSEVRRGMQVLVAADLAKETIPDKEWVVNRQSLRRTNKDVAAAIAERVRKAATKPPPAGRRSRKTTPGDGQETLF
ncbi:MAG: hypothetical protein ACOX61_01155 [Brooklawnia sp.]|jgi:hypothetical protein